MTAGALSGRAGVMVAGSLSAQCPGRRLRLVAVATRTAAWHDARSLAAAAAPQTGACNIGSLHYVANIGDRDCQSCLVAEARRASRLLSACMHQDQCRACHPTCTGRRSGISRAPGARLQMRPGQMAETTGIDGRARLTNGCELRCCC